MKRHLAPPTLTDVDQLVGFEREPGQAEDVRAECRRRFGDVPCSNVLNAKGEVIEWKDCTDWCPLLRRLIEEDEDTP